MGCFQVTILVNLAAISVKQCRVCSRFTMPANGSHIYEVSTFENRCFFINTLHNSGLWRAVTKS